MTSITKKMQFIAGGFAFLVIASTQAGQVSTNVSGTKGTALGKITFEDSEYGLLIKPQLSGLPEGMHGFHIHEYPDCDDAGMKAGGHLDPQKTNSHQGPYGKGHRGDLPLLAVGAKGEAITVLLAPRLKTADIQGHAIMIHEGGDNYSDTPPLGGGGARIACGKIQ